MIAKFKVILEKEPEGSYSVYVPALPGCHTQGDSVKEALENAKEAIECYIESLKKDNLPIPTVQEELIEEVEVTL